MSTEATERVNRKRLKRERSATHAIADSLVRSWLERLLRRGEHTSAGSRIASRNGAGTGRD